MPNAPWHAPIELSVAKQAHLTPDAILAPDTKKTYSLAELIDLAESNNPETRLAWERARTQAEALGVAKSELYPTLATLAIADANRDQVYLDTRFYRQTNAAIEVPLDLNYTIFDFGARSGRIDAARGDLLAANFSFNDVHRRLIYEASTSYYQLLNATGQVAAAQAALANAQAVQQAAEARLGNGLATSPDVLEARAVTAQSAYDLQAAIGAEEVARGNLLTVLGNSPASTIIVQPIDELNIPDSVESSVDSLIDRALEQRPDLMQRIAAIRSATARLKETRAAYYPSLRVHAYPDPQALYSLQQTFPWGFTAGLNGDVSFQLEWNLFDGGARRHRTAEAAAQLHAEQANAAVTRDKVENEVWTAYSNLKTAFRQREAASALLTAADQSYTAEFTSYHAGVRNLLDVTEAQQTLARARSTDVLARTQVLTALAALAFETAETIQPKYSRSHP
ncbi:outer membrane protein TolC [Silvibacterium bohemicum]|uniref:Outer membrane protein TolC n=1 Tax=Silvibacterium bohemicum TaxID=1577686 RepID=A0A841K902_9BACT|nr:TolC family protein [Silvibacterium bohemicum]MBB6146764.1 outer membrane protein TolC [Silvibacterium bohemicum]